MREFQMGTEEEIAQIEADLKDSTLYIAYSLFLNNKQFNVLVYIYRLDLLYPLNHLLFHL